MNDLSVWDMLAFRYEIRTRLDMSYVMSYRNGPGARASCPPSRARMAMRWGNDHLPYET